jgi:signal peptidase II
LKKFLSNYAPLLTIAVIIIVADQITKYLVRTNIPMGEMWSPWAWLAPYARIVNWKNTGAAFGMLQNFNLVFSILAVLVSIAILYYFPRVPTQEWPLRLAMGMQLGGAVGNLIDRVSQGYVTDFVSVGNFAVFNVADASISVGVVVLILGVWLMDRSEKKSSGDINADEKSPGSHEGISEITLAVTDPDPVPDDPSSSSPPDRLHSEH